MYYYANNHKICLHGYGTKIENYVDLEFTFKKKPWSIWNILTETFFQKLILMTKPCVSWPWDSLHIAPSPGHCVTR